MKLFEYIAALTPNDVAALVARHDQDIASAEWRTLCVLNADVEQVRWGKQTIRSWYDRGIRARTFIATTIRMTQEFNERLHTYRATHGTTPRPMMAFRDVSEWEFVVGPALRKLRRHLPGTLSHGGRITTLEHLFPIPTFSQITDVQPRNQGSYAPEYKEIACGFCGFAERVDNVTWEDRVRARQQVFHNTWSQYLAPAFMPDCYEGPRNVCASEPCLGAAVGSWASTTQFQASIKKQIDEMLLECDRRILEAQLVRPVAAGQVPYLICKLQDDKKA